MFLDKLKFHAWDSVDVVVGKLHDWTPVDCKSEREFERSLYAYLHTQLPEIQVTKQFAQGRIRADINVGSKVIVELKNNLDTTAKYQRLIGQLNEYREWDGRVVILLTGATEPNLRKQLDAFIKREESPLDDLWGGSKMTVFQK